MRAEIAQAAGVRQIEEGSTPGVREPALELVDRGAGDQLRRAAARRAGATGIDPSAPALPVRPG